MYCPHEGHQGTYGSSTLRPGCFPCIPSTSPNSSTRGHLRVTNPERTTQVTRAHTPLFRGTLGGRLAGSWPQLVVLYNQIRHRDPSFISPRPEVPKTDHSDVACLGGKTAGVARIDGDWGTGGKPSLTNSSLIREPLSLSQVLASDRRNSQVPFLAASPASSLPRPRDAPGAAPQCR